MVKMGNVWDRTLEVMNGRGGMLAGIAILTLFVPAAISAAIRAYAPASVATSLIAGLLALATTIVAVWGQLAIIAASTDPAVDRPRAFAAATSRVGAALLTAVVLAIALAVLFLPMVVLLLQAGFDWSAAASGAAPTAPTAPGMAALAGLYAAVLGLAMLFLGGRLLPMYAIVLHERLSLGAIRRSWQLTRRHTWRLFGTVVLFLIVLLVAMTAAQSVIGLVVRLVLGAGALPTVAFIAALAGQAVSTALTLVAIVFTAQLYVALTTREQALRSRAASEAAA